MYTKEQRAAWQRAYYHQHKDIVKAINKRHRINHLDDVMKVANNWRAKNPQYDNQHYQENRTKIIKSAVTRAKIKYRADPQYRTMMRCRSRIHNALKSSYVKKNLSTNNLLGCSTKELKLHIESRFQQGMTWNNYGEWHIDHIIPCAVFDLSDPVEQKQCFHYSNLQPLWAKDNLSKSDKISSLSGRDGFVNG